MRPWTMSRHKISPALDEKGYRSSENKNNNNNNIVVNHDAVRWRDAGYI